MNDRQRNIAIFIASTIGFCILLFIFAVLHSAIEKIFEFAGLPEKFASWVVILGVCALIVFAVINRQRISQFFKAIFLGVGQYLLLYYVYYGKIYDYFLAHFGFEPRYLALSQTFFLIFAVGVVWYGSFYVFDVKPSLWKAYTLISVIGPFVIFGIIWSQPYNLFDHTAKDASGNYVTKAKAYILKDDNGKVIDVMYSPGISTRYGKPLTAALPEDVKGIEEYLKNNSKISFIYGGNKGSVKTPQLVTILEKSFTDADIDPVRGNITGFIWDERFKVGDTICIDGQIPEGAPEIEIHRGKNFNPEWLTTTNGKFEFPIKQVPASGTYCLVWIEKDKNIKFTLRVVGMRSV
jgi:hypothetical protein